MVQLPSAPSESGNGVSCLLAASCARASTTPASQVIELVAASISRILSSRTVETTIAWRSNEICPPTRPVLPPCGTIAVFVSCASLRISETSSVDPGFSTMAARPWYRSRGSCRNGAISAGSRSAYLSPTISAKRSIGAAFDAAERAAVFVRRPMSVRVQARAVIGFRRIDRFLRRRGQGDQQETGTAVHIRVLAIGRHFIGLLRLARNDRAMKTENGLSVRPLFVAEL